jgi:prepilin-type N-terminal cleavage/methylation domain-containing protein
MKLKASFPSKKRLHSKNGFSLIEMLMGMFIMSFVAAAIAEIATMQNVVFFKTYGKLDNIVAARRAASDIEQAIHMARFIGDQFGEWPPSVGSHSGPNYFPGGGPVDPYALSGPNDSLITGFAGFPSTTSISTWPAPPYSLSQQTLIVQVPVFSASPPDACPTILQYAPSGNNYVSDNYWNVDTYVYQILADTTKPGTGQFVLQKTIFPGEYNSNTQSPPIIQSNSPKTLMTGIIGPVNPTGPNDPIAGTPPPSVFNYLGRPPVSLTAPKPAVIQSVGELSAPGIVGVTVDLELSNASAAIRADYVPSPIAYHSEFYVRSNAVSGY